MDEPAVDPEAEFFGNFRGVPESNAKFVGIKSLQRSRVVCRAGERSQVEERDACSKVAVQLRHRSPVDEIVDIEIRQIECRQPVGV